jgi:hypothetical protein
MKFVTINIGLLTIGIGLEWKYMLDGKLRTMTIAFPEYVPGDITLAVTPRHINMIKLTQLGI